MKLLVAWATRQGSTRASAIVLARALSELPGIEAEERDAARVGTRDLGAYDGFVVGSSIVAGMWKGSAKRLVAKLGKAGKPLAVFVSAGGAMTGKKPGSAPDAPPEGTIAERQAQAVSLYLDPVLAKLGVEPLAKTAFGGRMTMFGKLMFDSWDAAPVEAWAPDLAKAFGAK
ncbi:MAG: hypothetical protein JXA15_00635 [Spirochaetales bacterium]|nr:hypothetical protein [Spirochaetales bacterium]